MTEFLIGVVVGFTLTICGVLFYFVKELIDENNYN